MQACLTVESGQELSTLHVQGTSKGMIIFYYLRRRGERDQIQELEIRTMASRVIGLLIGFIWMHLKIKCALFVGRICHRLHFRSRFSGLHAKPNQF